MTGDAPAGGAAVRSHRAALLREWPALVVGAGVAVGLAAELVGPGFRTGALVIAASVVLAAWLRALLPSDAAGVLAVRRRAVDVMTLAVLGLGLTALALLVPPGG